MWQSAHAARITHGPIGHVAFINAECRVMKKEGGNVCYENRGRGGARGDKRRGKRRKSVRNEP